MKQSRLPNSQSNISLISLLPNRMQDNWLYKTLAIIGDRLFGISKLRDTYEKIGLSGLDKQDFCSKLLQELNIQIEGENTLLDCVPKTGGMIIVCNHPHGMLDGIIIAKLLTSQRKDTKILANIGLKMIKEIREYFIFSNPLKANVPINIKAIKQCIAHVKQGGLLVIFPAGRVSFYHKENQKIADGEWNRITINIATKTKAPILPVHVSGKNSNWFYRIGRIYYRFRLLMLAREMLKSKDSKISLSSLSPITINTLKKFKTNHFMNQYIRANCYLNDSDYFKPWSTNKEIQSLEPVIEAVNGDALRKEISLLPNKQRLLAFKNYVVYYGYKKQLPLCVKEITRLREITFREHDEGSGSGCDTDKFDQTYMHLFIFDHTLSAIIGAYRIGHTDLLQKNSDQSKLYLSQMFKFNNDFNNQIEPCLEMGRSFIVKEHQKSFFGLQLLWKGIGRYLCQNPRYRTMYGTVSLSKLYDPRSVAIINKLLVKETNSVHAKHPFHYELHPEVQGFLAHNKISIKQMSELIKGIENDNKDIPVLLRQYEKLSATFHCMGIDNNFNNTPGLLLSIDLTKAPDKLLKLYLGKDKEKYLNYHKK